MKEIENEITVRITCDKNELIKLLESKGLSFESSFVLDDTYYLKSIKENVRDTLKDAIIIRQVINNEHKYKELVYKIKDIDEKGEILSQEKYCLKIEDVDEANDFISKLGYKKVFNIIEDDLIYTYEGIGLVVKDVKDLGLLMEIETRKNSKYENIESLIQLVNELDLPIIKNDYFVKKAELALDKYLKGEKL